MTGQIDADGGDAITLLAEPFAQAMHDMLTAVVTM